MEAVAERPMPLSICVILVMMALEVNSAPPGPVHQEAENGAGREEKKEKSR